MDEALERNRKEYRSGILTLWISQVTRTNIKPPHTQRNTREQNKMRFVLFKRALSPARYVLEDPSYRNRRKIDAGDASLLMGSIN